jgi:hypothetical protein
MAAAAKGQARPAPAARAAEIAVLKYNIIGRPEGALFVPAASALL